jgi:hypothetical protein
LHIKRATALQYQGNLTSAAREINAALRLLPPEETENRTAMIALWISIDILSRIPEIEEVQSRISQLERLCASEGSPTDQIRLDWLRARVAFLDNNPRDAVDLFERTAEAWARLGHGYKWALVTLEKALVHLAVGDTRTVRRIVSGALPTLSALKVSVDVMAAFKLLGKAQDIDSEMVKGLLQHLERLPPRSRKDRL